MPDELTNTANRIVLEVDIATLNSGQFRGGVDTINVNSDMVNELVIRVGKFVGTALNRKFVQSVLPNGERLWIDFAHGQNTKTYILAERPNTNIREIDNETIVEDTSGTEYYMKLPLEIMLQSGTWTFAISRKHVKSEVETEGEVPVYDEDDEIAYYRIVPTKSYVFDYVKTSEDYTMVVNTSIAQKSGFDHVTNATIQQIWDSIMAGAVTSINDQHGNVHTFKGVFNASNVYYAGDSLVYDDKLYLVIANRLTPSAVTPKNDTTHFKAYGGAIENIIWNGEILEKDADGNVEIPVDDEATEDSGNAITSGAVYTAIAEEAERATEAEQNISDALATEISTRETENADLAEQISDEATTRATADTQLQASITAEVTRATGAESDLSDAIEEETEAREEAIETVDNKLNYPFAQTVSVTATAQVVTITLSRRNIKTGATDTNSTTIPIANAVNAGLMTPESVTALQQLGTRVSALENTNIHLLYDEDLRPTPADIRQFVINEGYTDTTQWVNITVDVLGSTNVWRYFDATHGWTEQVPVVARATNTTLGIVKGSQTDGKIYVEDDGTLSVNGWNDLQDVILGMQSDIYDEEQRATQAEQALASRVSANEADITSLGGRMTNAESDIDDLGEAVDSLETTVSGHTTSIATNATNIATEATARANADLSIKALLIGYTEVE